MHHRHSKTGQVDGGGGWGGGIKQQHSFHLLLRGRRRRRRRRHVRVMKSHAEINREEKQSRWALQLWGKEEAEP